jgi:hypothetical protein
LARRTLRQPMLRGRHGDSDRCHNCDEASCHASSTRSQVISRCSAPLAP